MFPKRHIISHTATIREALDALNRLSGTASMTLFVVSGEDRPRVLGTLTDGDIRRALLDGNDLTAPVTAALRAGFRSVPSPVSSAQNVGRLRQYRSQGINLIPVLDDEGCLTDVIDLTRTHSRLPLTAVLMAGGKGERLRPLTLTTPKPLLQIEGKAIIDYNIAALAACGIDDITVTTRYLAEQIRDHFARPVEGVSVRCVTETMPLGTIGSVTLADIPDEGDTLVMNSDLITSISFEDMFLRHYSEKADVTVAVIPYQVSVPFAIVTTDGAAITGIEEKPSYSYFANAGIYIFSNSVLHRVKADTRTDATDLIAEVIADGGRVVYFPVDGTWLDVGSPADFDRAAQLMRHHRNLSATL